VPRVGDAGEPMHPLSVLLLAAGLVCASPASAADDGEVTVVAFDAGAIVAVEVAIGAQLVTTPATVRVPAGRQPLRLGARVLAELEVPAGGALDVAIDLGSGEALIDGGAAATAPSATPPPPTLATSGTLRLRVQDGDVGGPVAGAEVALRGQGRIGTVDDQGLLEVVVPAGPGAVSVVAAGFIPRIAPVEVPVGGVLELTVTLLPLADELDELTVSAPHLRGGAAVAVAERRAEKQLVEVVGAEQMKKSGDSDAAAALRRVTGLTLVGGRFVYVRGLGDRYSSTLVNGAVLPSPEPERRVVPLDLFPSSLLEALVVQKTWSPDLPGEFGGGSVQLRTRSHPEAPLLTASMSTTFIPGTTGATHALAPSGWLDVLAMDDGSRAVPAGIVAASRERPLAEGNALTGGGLTRKELEGLGESISPAWSPRPSTVLPGLSLQATAGDTFVTPWGRLGAIGGVTWSQDALHTETSRQLTASGQGGDVVVTDDLMLRSTERSTSLGGVLGLAFSPAEGQRLRAVTLLNRSADDDARIISGYDQDIDGQLRLTRLRFVARQLVVQQFLGEHALPWAPLSVDDDDGAELRWRLAWALAAREEPGQRLTRYDQGNDGVFRLSDRSDGNQLLTSSLLDQAVDAGATLRLPLDAVWADASASAGVATAVKFRGVETRRYKFLLAGPLASDAALRALAPENVFTPATIGPDGFMLAEATRNTDNHTGSSVVGAAFIAAEAPLWPGVLDDVVVSGGLRLEGSRLEVTTFELFNAAATPVVAELANVDLLPSLAVAWTALDDVTLKVAAARTVVRPELRELSPAVYTDVAGGRARFGNPDLEETGVVHLDARVEWAWSPRDGASLAAFGKHFDKPIESVVTAGADQAITAANVDAAVNVGAEVEGRVGLDTVLGAFGLEAPGLPVVDGLWLGANGALIWSRVLIGEAQQGTLTSTERALEGQSPWVVNLQLGSDDDARGFSAALLYNVFGPRIVEVGALGLPDAVEEPFHQLDAVVRQRLPWGLTLSLQARNLIDLPATRSLGGRTVESVTRGRAFSVGVGWAW